MSWLVAVGCTLPSPILTLGLLVHPLPPGPRALPVSQDCMSVRHVSRGVVWRGQINLFIHQMSLSAGWAGLCYKHRGTVGSKMDDRRCPHGVDVLVGGATLRNDTHTQCTW